MMWFSHKTAHPISCTTVGCNNLLVGKLYKLNTVVSPWSVSSAEVLTTVPLKKDPLYRPNVNIA